MRTVDVALGARGYPIHIGADLLARGDLILPHLKSRHAAIITNTTVAALHLESLQSGLEAVGVNAIPVILPDGEAYKDWATLNLIFDALLSSHCDRSTTLIALGGGVPFLLQRLAPQ